MHLQTKTAEEIEKYSKRTVRVTRQHNDECKRLLTLMGVPIIEVGPAATAAHCLHPQLVHCKARDRNRCLGIP